MQTHKTTVSVLSVKSVLIDLQVQKKVESSVMLQILCYQIPKNAASVERPPPGMFTMEQQLASVAVLFFEDQFQMESRDNTLAEREITVT